MAESSLYEHLTTEALRLGATKAAVISASLVETDRRFRDMCASNACGMYGKCYMCPPDIGEIDALMDELRGYDHALVYQVVSELEDSFDYEGMVEAKKCTYPLAQSLREVFSDARLPKVLHLGAGGCGVCNPCAKRTGEPCRFPEKAMSSLEAYGINVSRLAAASGMKYINGQNTVTYFGAVFFCETEK